MRVMTRRVLLFVGLLLAGCVWHHPDPIYGTEAAFNRDTRECYQVGRAAMGFWDHFDYSSTNFREHYEGYMKARGGKAW